MYSNFKITIPFLPISGVQVSTCVLTSKVRASKAMNADDNLADPQQTDTLLSQEAQQRVPAGEDCLCQGQNCSQTKRENIQLRWESLHSSRCEANKQGSDRNTSPAHPCLKDLPHGPKAVIRMAEVTTQVQTMTFILGVSELILKLWEIFLQNSI